MTDWVMGILPGMPETVATDGSLLPTQLPRVSCPGDHAPAFKGSETECLY